MGGRRISETLWGLTEFLRPCGGSRYQKDWCRLHVRHVHIVATQSCPALGWLGTCVCEATLSEATISGRRVIDNMSEVVMA